VQVLHIRRKACPGHRGGRLHGLVDGVKILYCPICKGVRLKATALSQVKPSSILKMADICDWYLPKQEKRSPEFLINKAREHFRMDYRTAWRALQWLVKAGLYQLSIDGVVAVRAGFYARLKDALGDPPLLQHSLTCWRCGRGISLDDVPEGSDFGCPRCKKPYEMLPGSFVRAK